MPLYRKKPVVVTAYKLTIENIDWVANWCDGEVIGTIPSYGPVYIIISTLEGQMTAQLGDYVIKGVKGEFYPCKSDIFEETYEEERLRND